jgi:hypothetical protein
MIEDDPKNWTIGPDRTQGASDYYSIQRVKEKEQIIIATGVKNSNNKPYYLIFSRNRNHNQQPWFFEKITTCTNYINNKPICITDSIKIDDLVKLETINTESIDFDHIFSTKNEEKGIFRFPMKFQKLSYDIRTSRLSEIIENSFNSQKQNIKSTIRYDKEINQIVFCHYLPLDFSGCGGTKHELYACLRKIEGPGNRFEIPTILPYHMVYSQLLEKPKIDHWTYALCKFEENEIKKENQELKKRNQELKKRNQELEEKLK